VRVFVFAGVCVSAFVRGRRMKMGENLSEKEWKRKSVGMCVCERERYGANKQSA